MIIFENLDGFLPYQNSIWTDPRHWAACGFFSLHHAMVFLGQAGSYSDMRNKHNSLWDMIFEGTLAEPLINLAKKEGLHAQHYETQSIKSYRRHLDQDLRAGSPVIIGSEPANHWICLGGRTYDGGYVWADSADGNAAIGAFGSWNDLEEWLTDGDAAELEEPFSSITISPGKKMPASRSMVPWIGGVYESLNSDSVYAHDWSNLLGDMLDVFWDHEYASKGVSAGEFLDQHLDGIVEATASISGHDESALVSLANGYRNVADFHNLVVAKGHDAQSISAFAHKLAAKANAIL